MHLGRLVSLGALSMLAIAACGSDDDAGSVATDDAAVTTLSAEADASDSSAPLTAPAESDATEGLDELYPTEPTDTQSAETTPTETGGGAAPADGAGLQLLDTAIGSVLGDADGYAVYLFTPDEQGDSTCYDECESNWPFIAEVGEVGAGLDPELLGTTERSTGETQATYNGWPLYAFSGDATPGDTNGQGVGGVWFAIDATGTAIDG